MNRILSSLLLLSLLLALLSGCNLPGSVTDSSTAPNDSSSAVSTAETEQPKETIVATDGHTDKDDNGLCDDCGCTVVILFDLFALNDLHGKVVDSDVQPGVDELTTYLKAARAENPNTILLSSGDMWQGSSESNLTKGLLVTEWMNAVGFSSMTLGNHEYDWGESYIEANLAIAEFPFLAINVYHQDTNTPVSYCAPSVMIEQSGLQIGIIGAVGDCYSSISGDKVSEIYFKTGNALTELVKAEADRLREAGADLIIYSIHDGYGRSSGGTTNVTGAQLSDYYDPTLSEGFVDIVFEGHTHQSYVMKDDCGVYHLQNGGDNRGISHAEVEINFANGNTTVKEAEFLPTSTYTKLDDDPVIEELLQKYADEIGKANLVLGKNDAKRSGNELRQLIAKLYYLEGERLWGERYDLVLGGGYISVRSPGNLKTGDVLYSQLQTLFPFDNELVLCSISGADLRSRFLNTNNSNYFIHLGNYGNSVADNIDPSKTYYVVTDTYSSTYAPNRLTEISRDTRGVYARDLLAEYVKSGGLSSAATDNSPPTVLTSIPKILEIGSALNHNEITKELYLVRGKIVEIENTVYGNMTITDDTGNTLYVYGVYDSSGKTRYDALPDPPRVGYTVTLCAVIKKYVKQNTVIIELLNARLIEG